MTGVVSTAPKRSEERAEGESGKSRFGEGRCRTPPPSGRRALSPLPESSREREISLWKVESAEGAVFPEPRLLGLGFQGH